MTRSWRGALLVVLTAWWAGSGMHAAAAGHSSVWDWGRGCDWTVVPTPTVVDAQLQGVDGTAWNDAWAVGKYLYSPAAPVILRWGGASWSHAPQVPTARGDLEDVAAISPTDAWAVGYNSSIFDDDSLARHWNGTIWRPVPTPSLLLDRLYGVSAASPRMCGRSGTITMPTGFIRWPCTGTERAGGRSRSRRLRR